VTLSLPPDRIRTIPPLVIDLGMVAWAGRSEPYPTTPLAREREKSRGRGHFGFTKHS
jgi:hypothetical protein